MKTEYLTNIDILMCKNVEVKMDQDMNMVMTCSLSGLPCEDVLRYADEDGCAYEREEAE